MSNKTAYQVVQAVMESNSIMIYEGTDLFAWHKLKEFIGETRRRSVTRIERPATEAILVARLLNTTKD